ncbi:MAG: hypothetical protein V1729_04215 [Candidatus Woesearchaeota archaeon]
MIEKIIKQLDGLHKEIRKVMPLVQGQVNDVIDGRMTDTKYIEGILDDILGIVPLGYGVEEFRKLNHYYSTFSPDNSAVYQRYLDESLE